MEKFPLNVGRRDQNRAAEADDVLHIDHTRQPLSNTHPRHSDIHSARSRQNNARSPPADFPSATLHLSTCRDDDSRNTSIMTTTAAHANRASSIITERHEPPSLMDHDAARPTMKGTAQVGAQPEVKKADKKSTEYLIKSGLAGGFAGCAVCMHQSDCRGTCDEHMLTCILSSAGQNSSRPS